MKNLFKLFLIVSLVLGFAGASFAQDEEVVTDEIVVDENAGAGDEVIEPVEGAVEAPAMEHKKGDAVEFTGNVEVTPADAAKGEKYATILLKVGEEAYKLIPSENKEAFNGLEAAAGKTVKVKGTFLPADDQHPLPAIMVTEWAE